MDSRVFQYGGDESANLFASDRLMLRSVLKTWLEFMETAAQTITTLIPGRINRLAWLELQNKLRAFYFFQHCDSVVGLSAVGCYDVQRAFSRLGSLEKWGSLWAAEGVGRQCASSPQRDLPAVMRKAAAAGGYLLPFHTGMGMSFAETALYAAEREQQTIGGSLDHFFELCRVNSQEGFAEAAYETLGLVARTLFPNLIHIIDTSLTRNYPEMLSYFWHGVGRGLYFLPTGSLPAGGLSWEAIQRANREPPHNLGRLNATAGAAWAFTLVNINHPEILEAFFEKRGREIPLDDAFVNGVQSALIIWHQCTGEWTPLCDDSMGMNGTKDLWFWRKYVRAPWLFARRCGATIAEKHQIGKLFHYRTLSEWTGESPGEVRPMASQPQHWNRKGFRG